MAYKRILTVQDISCLGQCSTTVALPILSACGQETCILPSAVLSTHTGGFSGMTFRDLAEDLPPIAAHWKKESISFDAIYTGYLGSTKQIDYVEDIFRTLLAPGGKIIVDPAMADHGKLYKGFDENYVAAMRRLCALADVILPNLTEASLLLGMPYHESCTEAEARYYSERLCALGAKSVLLTGVGFQAGDTGVYLWEKGTAKHYPHKKIPKNYHGTGDIFASAFTGAWVSGKEKFRAAQIAADFVLDCIEKTAEDPAHWYGVKFEAALPDLIKQLQ